MKDASDKIRDELTYKIIGCAMKVHNTLGGGFPEVIYQRCLALEMKSASLKFDREKEHRIFYNGQCVGSRRADFVVDNKVIIELKAVFALEDIHFVQAKNYVVAYNFPKGLLINFGGRSLEYKLLFNQNYQNLQNYHDKKQDNDRDQGPYSQHDNQNYQNPQDGHNENQLPPNDQD